MRKTEIVYTESLFYVYAKKHFCPVCGDKVKVSHTSKFIKPETGRKNGFFSVNGVYFYGSLEIREKCFLCMRCKRNISFKEMKECESRF